MIGRAFGILRRFTPALALAIAVAAAAPATAQTVNDADGDGVQNGVDLNGDGVLDTGDLCPDTPRGDLINMTTGCSFCVCDAGWASHTAYVSCVTAAANQEYLLKHITKTRKSQALTAAKNSTCGTPNVTRCCQWRKLVYGSLGTCTVMDPARCSYQVLGKWAENRGSGSCTYNPCTW